MVGICSLANFSFFKSSSHSFEFQSFSFTSSLFATRQPKSFLRRARIPTEALPPQTIAKHQVTQHWTQGPNGRGCGCVIPSKTNGNLETLTNVQSTIDQNQPAGYPFIAENSLLHLLFWPFFPALLCYKPVPTNQPLSLCFRAHYHFKTVDHNSNLILKISSICTVTSSIARAMVASPFSYRHPPTCIPHP